MAASTSPSTIRVVIERGQKKAFASAIDWPGWSRSGKTPEAALEALMEYEPRYRAFLKSAGVKLPASPDFTVVETVKGNATTDFGAPGVVADVQCEPVTAAQAKRLAAITEAAWAYLAHVAETAPEELRKGPRGGGRDTSQIVAHVADPEGAYARKMGITTRGLEDVRGAIADYVRSAATYEAGSTPWPPAYAAMKAAWHVLDHAWEIEDRSEA